ncbi:MAG: leucine-rich repeat domain-containing protein [Lachnospiraceae bacterium]|nr:leucine-rich repeat domain-containing protein [Lachnospiraceae bacterium]
MIAWIKKNKKTLNVFFCTMVIAVCISACLDSRVVKAANPDTDKIMKKAFDKYNYAEMIFATIWSKDYSTDSFVEDMKNYPLGEHIWKRMLYDRKNSVASGDYTTPHPGSSEYYFYTDLKSGRIYVKDKKYPKWSWIVAERTDLEAPVDRWIVDGKGTTLCAGETWHYDGIETITQESPYTQKQTEYKCHKIWAKISINDYWNNDSYNKKYGPKEETVCYYVTVNGNDIVYIKALEEVPGLSGVDLVCLKKTDKSKVVTIPETIRKYAECSDADKIEDNNVFYCKRGDNGKEYLEVIGAKDVSSATIPNKITVQEKFYEAYEYKIENKTYPVKAIKEYAFYNNNHLKNITINADISDIEEGAFENAKKLKKIVIKSKKIKNIGKSAFDTNSKKLKIKLYGSKKQKKKQENSSRNQGQIIQKR